MGGTFCEHPFKIGAGTTPATAVIAEHLFASAQRVAAEQISAQAGIKLYGTE